MAAPDPGMRRDPLSGRKWIIHLLLILSIALMGLAASFIARLLSKYR